MSSRPPIPTPPPPQPAGSPQRRLLALIPIIGGVFLLIVAMIVVIVGGTGSIQGAFFGGLIIGLLDAFGKAYFPNFAYFAIYSALILILLFKPSGLMGRVMRVQMTADQLQPAPGSGQKMRTAKEVIPAEASQPVWQSRRCISLPHPRLRSECRLFVGS